jgi:preprotein translocase subunit SecA
MKSTSPKHYCVSSPVFTIDIDDMDMPIKASGSSTENQSELIHIDAITEAHTAKKIQCAAEQKCWGIPGYH